jgi:hypothetical protein
MSDNKSYNLLYNRSPLYQLFIALFVVLGVGILLLTLFIITGLYAFDADYMLLGSFTDAANENEVSFLRYVLIAQEISFFIIPAIIILILLKPSGQSLFADVKITTVKDAVLVILLAVCLFPLTSFTGYLNSTMELPVWLSGVEQWMTEKEDELANLTNLIIASNNLGGMLFNLIMIAILPAIGEELIFRGIFQKILYGLMKNSWLAIWISALVFSAIHLQFYGFLPRFILGLVYGYLFFWSGTLLLPVLAHFVNNAVPTIGAYLYAMENSGINAETPVSTQLAGLILPVILVVLILSYFRNKSKMDLYG